MIGLPCSFHGMINYAILFNYFKSENLQPISGQLIFDIIVTDHTDFITTFISNEIAERMLDLSIQKITMFVKLRYCLLLSLSTNKIIITSNLFLSCRNNRYFLNNCAATSEEEHTKLK